MIFQTAILLIAYVQNQRAYIMTYLEDGHCSLSNQMSENSIRPVTVGRRNWLFCDSTDGADASMAIFSLLETARANGLNPQKYLEYLLEPDLTNRCLTRNLRCLHPGRHQFKPVA